jgi:hypothetical protein
MMPAAMEKGTGEKFEAIRITKCSVWERKTQKRGLGHKYIKWHEKNVLT